MSNNALIRIYDEKLDRICCIYQHRNASLTELGNELKAILKYIILVNGFSGNTTNKANGMGCLAANIIKNLKNGIGDVYLYPTNIEPEQLNVDYVYEIMNVKDKIYMRIHQKNYAKTLYADFIENFDVNTIVYN